MIHHILSLTRPLIIPDCETTGLDPKSDRIIELGFQLWTANGLEKEWRSLINPGVPLTPESMKVHGISEQSLISCQRCSALRENHPSLECAEFHGVPSFLQIAPSLAKGFCDCDYAGKNVRFDLRILSAEFARAKIEWSYIGARIIDVDRLEHLGEPRTLAALYEKHLGKKMEDAHQALADVRATTELLVAQLKKYRELPRDLDQLHEAQWPGWIDGEGKFAFIDGVACFGRWGKYAGRPMSVADQGYWDFILRGDFSADVKKLASEAKMGRFPIKKEMV